MAETIAADEVRTNHDASALAFERLFGWTAESAAFIDVVSERATV